MQFFFSILHCLPLQPKSPPAFISTWCASFSPPLGFQAGALGLEHHGWSGCSTLPLKQAREAGQGSWNCVLSSRLRASVMTQWFSYPSGRLLKGPLPLDGCGEPLDSKNPWSSCSNACSTPPWRIAPHLLTALLLAAETGNQDD